MAVGSKRAQESREAAREATAAPGGEAESIEISARGDVYELKPGAIGLAGVLFAALSAATALTAMIGNTPYAVGSGNGVGAPWGFLFATILLTTSVGHVAMARKLTTAEGFCSFLSHGLGRRRRRSRKLRLQRQHGVRLDVFTDVTKWLVTTGSSSAAAWRSSARLGGRRRRLGARAELAPSAGRWTTMYRLRPPF